MRKWLKDLREEKQKSQQIVAEALGTTQQYYSLIENGERKKQLELSMAVKLAEIFNVSVDWIIKQEAAIEKVS